MDGIWQIELWDEETATGDGGWVTLIRLTHFATGIALAANVCEYEDDPRFVNEIVQDDMSLPSAVVRRLVTKVFNRYARSYREGQDMGSSGMTTCDVLADLIDDLYPPNDGTQVKAVMQDAFQAVVTKQP